MHNGAAFKLFVGRLKSSIAAAKARASLSESATDLDARLQRLIEVTQTLWTTGDPQLTLANASVYLEAFGHITIAWIWLEQAIAACDKQGDFYDGKRSAAGYFFRWELPKVDAQLTLLASLDRTTLDMQDAWF